MSNLPPGCPSDDELTPNDRAWVVLLERIVGTRDDEGRLLTPEAAAQRWDSQPDLLKAVQNVNGALEVIRNTLAAARKRT